MVLTPIAQQVCEKRYFERDDKGNIIEDWAGLCTRVVNHVCQKETQEFRDKIYDLIYNTKFLPNSPCLVNAGRKGSHGLLACHVSPPPEDSWVGMMKNVETFGHVARRGGGNGMDLSKIRPEGDTVFGSTHAKACGPVHHLEVISAAMYSITQAGFRGMANMATLRVDHPDIFKFIKCKQRDNALRSLLREDISNHYETLKNSSNSHINILLDKHISNFNISVLVTDDFMNKVENDQNLDLIFNERIYKTVKARDVFNTIAENAWANGDPGMLFYSTINSGPYKYSGQETTATNPCITGDTLIAVADGRDHVSIAELANQGVDVPVYCCDTKTGNIHIRMGRNPRKTQTKTKVIKINCDDGGSVKLTPNHKLLLVSGEYKEAKDLQIGDSIMPMEKKKWHNGISGISRGDGHKAKNELLMLSDFYVPYEFPKETANFVILGKEIIGTKIISFENIEEPTSVYNITVDEFHNYCIYTNEGLKTDKHYKTKKTRDFRIFNYIVVKNCGEQPLPPLGSCNLGSIDVSKFFNETKKDINWKDLKETINATMQFLDNAIDVNVFPTADFEKWGKENRPVGLGIMGWADSLLKLQITYGSKESIDLANKVGKLFEDTSHAKSVELGKERGTPKACQFKELDFRRNVTTLSIAPTGTISLLAGCSSSIEPIFSPVIYRYDNTGHYEMKHPDADKSYFRCASDLSWKEHIDIQAIFQSYVCSGISKTINMSNDVTIQDVKDAYMYAWKNKCKGITIYRDGCKTVQVLNTQSKSAINYNNAPKRPKEVEADIFKKRADGFDWHIIVGKVDGKPYELFAVNGKTDLPNKGRIVKHQKRHYSLVGEDDSVLIDNIDLEEKEIDSSISLETRRFSLELRHGIHPQFIVKQIDKSSAVVTSFSKAVGRLFKSNYLGNDSVEGNFCEECVKNGLKTKMIYESGCQRCPTCFTSKCG